jgi:hypothetical protein
MLVVVAAGAFAVGCGSSDNTCSDAGCPDGGLSTLDTAPLSDGPMLWGLSRGTNNFTVTGISKIKDDCMIGVEKVVNMTLPVTYDEATMMISIGDVQGSPPGPSLGTGKVGANMATLTRDNKSGVATAACFWDQKDVSMLVLFNHDKFTLDVTENESAFAPGCTGMTPPPPVTGKCTSTWQWTLEKK